MKRYLRLLRPIVIGTIIATGFSGTASLEAAPAPAAEGIAMSGSFYQQSFEIPQGASVSGPDVYVVVYNTGSNELRVKMSGTAPAGVQLTLSKTDFILPVRGQEQVRITVAVGAKTVPGDYPLSIVAEPYVDTASGIRLLGAASQKANLHVTGESGHVNLQAVSPDGTYIVSTVRLFRVDGDQNHELAYSEKGNLDVVVAPGDFKAVSVVGGIQIAETKFSLASGEAKNILLSGATVYFEGFDIVPTFRQQTNELAFLQVVYTVTNIYQRINEGQVTLQVSHDGTPIAETTLASLSPLDTGRLGLNSNYVPASGWSAGNYEFKLQLFLDGKLYASSVAKQYTVAPAAGRRLSLAGFDPAPASIIGGLLAVVTLIIIVFKRMTGKRGYRWA